jgi:hypothetical protein
MSNFAVVGINGKTKNPGCLIVTDDAALAKSKADEAARAGWLFVEVCDSRDARRKWEQRVKSQTD